MNLQSILKEQKKKLRPSEEELKKINSFAKLLTEQLKSHLKSVKLDADVFIGGSFAKGTLLKGDKYDVDVFIRFNIKYDEIAKRLRPIIEKISKNLKWNLKVVHGSRDYFRLELPKENLIFEILPVNRIKRPEDEKNVTDLSYFHVSYVKKEAKNIEDDIRLAKQFCSSAEVYGAESYVGGFSGYALECLIINYGSFLKFLKGISKIEDKEVIDPSNHYKNKHSALLSMNESKTLGPILLVDPTFKERNVLAALNNESFSILKKRAMEFLKNPSNKFFEEVSFDLERFKQKSNNKNYTASCLKLFTDRQEGDIAGTKLKKCANFIISASERWLNIADSKFIYDGDKSALLYISWKSKDEELRKGPPIKMAKDVEMFKKQHRNSFVKANRIWAKVKINFSLKEVLSKVLESKEQIYRMGLTDYELNAI